MEEEVIKMNLVLGGKRDQQRKTGEFETPEYAITNLVILAHSGEVLVYGVPTCRQIDH